MAQEDEKKQEGAEDQPPPETILENEKQRDPDEAAFAEQAIHEYTEEVLDGFRDQVESALAGFVGWAQGQLEQDQLHDSGFNQEMGSTFLREMMAACGGQDTPIGAALFEQLDGIVDMRVRDTEDLDLFIQSLSSAARDFTWYLRDNLQAVLANEWDQLRDLAYEGSTDFIAALHAFGLPKVDWSGAGLTSTMVAMGEKLRESKPKTQQEAVEKDPKEEEEQKEQLLAEEEEKNQQAI